MYVIPNRVSATEYIVVVVLDRHSIDRILVRDPAEIGLHELPPMFREMKCRDIVITFGTDEDFKHVKELVAAGQVKDAFKLVTRGWKFRPELGDGNLSELLGGD